MNDPTITRQKLIRDRASAPRTDSGRAAMRAPSSAVAIARLSTTATSRPATAIELRTTSTPSAPSSRVARIWALVMWIETTSSAQLARANGPTVPRMTRPM